MSDNGESDRREFMGNVSRVAMAAGLIGGYGSFALIAGRYLYPARPTDRMWQYVAQVGTIAEGESLLYRGPSGETINVVRAAGNGTASDFIALSSTCPHLGCQVHWEPQNDRYFCPCHNGVFDPEGTAIAGPPGAAGQSLPRYPLSVENGLLFIEVPVGGLTTDAGVNERRDAVSAPGHDPCLACTPRFGERKKA